MKNELMNRVLKYIILVGLPALVLFTPAVSCAFGPGGHMIVAQIAFDRLNPNAKPKPPLTMAQLPEACRQVVVAP